MRIIPHALTESATAWNNVAMAAKRSTGFFYFFGSIVLLVGAIIFIAIFNKINEGSAPTDIRARAGTTSTLQFLGVIASMDSAKGTMTVDNLQLASESRSGSAKNYGTWEVTVPVQFNLNQAVPGTVVAIRVETKTFDVSSHKLLATDVILSR